jgi:hypothetical protein
MVEVTQRMDSVMLFFGRDVPHSQQAIVAASHDMPVFERIPLERVTLSLMTDQYNGRADFILACFEASFVKNVHFS